FIAVFLSLLSVRAYASTDSSYLETNISLATKSGNLFGTVTTPGFGNKFPIVLIIAGSGPTDRDGNNPIMKNNSLKFLAYGLAKQGIASLRYDKRGIGESKTAAKSEADLRFDDFVNDAIDWVGFLKQEKNYSSVWVAGHSEGSLIGMMAAAKADGFISIAGVGQSADNVLKDQLRVQPQSVQDVTFSIIDSLKLEMPVKKVSPFLHSLFRPSVQPYLISWFKKDPQTEIKKLRIPILIVQGTNDIQVAVGEANLLAAANANAKLVLVEDMNHILKNAKGNRQENISTYSNPSLPISGKLVQSISDFIKQQLPKH
ncbi:MAG: alpha/beta hydrolase, partial [Cytophagales bacterium]